MKSGNDHFLEYFCIKALIEDTTIDPSTLTGEKRSNCFPFLIDEVLESSNLLKGEE